MGKRDQNRLTPESSLSFIENVSGGAFVCAAHEDHRLFFVSDSLVSLFECKDLEDFSKVVTIKDIEAKDWNLSPNRYISYHKEEVRPYAEVLQEFKDALKAVQDAEAAFRKVINS